MNDYGLNWVSIPDRTIIFPPSPRLDKDVHNNNFLRCLVLYLAQKSVTEMEQPSNSPVLAPNDVWLFPKIKPALKGRRFHNTEDIQKKIDDGTESYSATGVPEMFATVAASLDYVHSCSRGAIRRRHLSVSCKYTGTLAIK
jgi:hypothetical protein